MIEIRWLENSEIETLVNPLLKQREWSELNINEAQPTCRVLGASIDGRILRSIAMQLYPLVGPLISHDEELRDSGEITRMLVAGMEDSMKIARDYLVIANSPVTVRLCERFGMEKISVPVYCRKPGRVE